jgi:hypothetical protein
MYNTMKLALIFQSLKLKKKEWDAVLFQSVKVITCWKNKKDVILICTTHSTKIIDVNDVRSIEGTWFITVHVANIILC